MTESTHPLVELHDRFTYAASHLQSVALLLLRIGIGFGLWFSAYGHLTHVENMVKQFTEWGVPAPRLNVYVSGYTEAIGGILLILGLGTRLISIPLIFNFLVAYLTASRGEFVRLFYPLFGGSPGMGHWDAWADVVNDSAMPFLVASFVTLAFGAGKVSLDYLLSRTVFRRPEPLDEVGRFPVGSNASPTQRQFQ